MQDQRFMMTFHPSCDAFDNCNALPHKMLTPSTAHNSDLKRIAFRVRQHNRNFVYLELLDTISQFVENFPAIQRKSNGLTQLVDCQRFA